MEWCAVVCCAVLRYTVVCCGAVYCGMQVCVFVKQSFTHFSYIIFLPAQLPEFFNINSVQLFSRIVGILGLKIP